MAAADEVMAAEHQGGGGASGRRVNRGIGVPEVSGLQ